MFVQHRAVVRHRNVLSQGPAPQRPLGCAERDFSSRSAGTVAQNGRLGVGTMRSLPMVGSLLVFEYCCPEGWMGCSHSCTEEGPNSEEGSEPRVLAWTQKYLCLPSGEPSQNGRKHVKGMSSVALTIPQRTPFSVVLDGWQMNWFAWRC